MDDSPLDTLTRRLRLAGSSRRAALGGLLVGTLRLLGSPAGPIVRAQKAKAAAGEHANERQGTRHHYKGKHRNRR